MAEQCVVAVVMLGFFLPFGLIHLFAPERVRGFLLTAPAPLLAALSVIVLLPISRRSPRMARVLIRAGGVWALLICGILVWIVLEYC